MDNKRARKKMPPSENNSTAHELLLSTSQTDRPEENRLKPDCNCVSSNKALVVSFDVMISLMDALSFFGTASLSQWKFNKNTQHNSMFTFEVAESSTIFCLMLAYRQLAAPYLTTKKSSLRTLVLLADLNNDEAVPVIRQKINRCLILFPYLERGLRLLEGYKIWLVTTAVLNSSPHWISIPSALTSGVLASCFWKNDIANQVRRLNQSFNSAKNDTPYLVEKSNSETYLFKPKNHTLTTTSGNTININSTINQEEDLKTSLEKRLTMIDGSLINLYDIGQSLSMASCMIGFLGAMSKFSSIIVEVFSRKCFQQLPPTLDSKNAYSIELVFFSLFFMINALWRWYIKKNILHIGNDNAINKESIRCHYHISETIALLIVALESTLTKTIPLLLALDMMLDVKSQDIPCHKTPENLSYILIIILAFMNSIKSWQFERDELRHYSLCMLKSMPLLSRHNDNWKLHLPWGPALDIVDDHHQKTYIIDSDTQSVSPALST